MRIHASTKEQNEVIEKLIELLGLPQLISSLKFEWKVGEIIRIETTSYLAAPKSLN